MRDLTGKIDPNDMPLCPLCDNAILDWDETEIIICGGAKGLAHIDCVEEEMECDERR